MIETRASKSSIHGLLAKITDIVKILTVDSLNQHYLTIFRKMERLHGRKKALRNPFE
jgi:hypothetical protein